MFLFCKIKIYRETLYYKLYTYILMIEDEEIDAL